MNYLTSLFLKILFFLNISFCAHTHTHAPHTTLVITLCCHSLLPLLHTKSPLFSDSLLCVKVSVVEGCLREIGWEVIYLGKGNSPVLTAEEYALNPQIINCLYFQVLKGLIKPLHDTVNDGPYLVQILSG